MSHGVLQSTHGDVGTASVPLLVAEPAARLARSSARRWRGGSSPAGCSKPGFFHAGSFPLPARPAALADLAVIFTGDETK